MSLAYIKNIINEIIGSKTGGLLVMSKGIGCYKVLADYLDTFTVKALTLYFLLNF